MVGPKLNCYHGKLLRNWRGRAVSWRSALQEWIHSEQLSCFELFGTHVSLLVEGFCLFVFFFPPPSSFCRLSARVHLGISLLLNELLVQEGGSEVPSGLGGDGGGGRGDVLFHMQSAMNWGKKQQKTHGNLFNKTIRVRAASGVADIVGEKPFKNEIKVELFLFNTSWRKEINVSLW